ncbi:hypothetical protein BJ170DRAFT_679547 [Xylariales sp. AK1849]|nr:hypothetical protein BJ170DRAFT_679547 [Xylariales sp. AK1849]
MAPNPAANSVADALMASKMSTDESFRLIVHLAPSDHADAEEVRRWLRIIAARLGYRLAMNELQCIEMMNGSELRQKSCEELDTYLFEKSSCGLALSNCYGQMADDVANAFLAEAMPACTSDPTEAFRKATSTSTPNSSPNSNPELGIKTVYLAALKRTLLLPLDTLIVMSPLLCLLLVAFVANAVAAIMKGAGA